MTPRVCIGVHVHAEPARLQATLDALAANTMPGVEVLLLPDGPDVPTQRALAALSSLRQFPTATPRGAPACFNRLIAATDADVVVLLESGALVAPGWLAALLAALDGQPTYGLAGPSTNHAWNEQGVFPGARGTPDDIARTARAAAARYCAAARVLTPLHSLADFCYAVKRDVIAAVGAADEQYGLGPCWEMDYNIRAARAGWAGVWAGAAYVHRAPFTARRRHEEAQRFEASKRLYQDRFCGRRLRGEPHAYEPHCRGEACEHFAPRGLIRIHLPAPADAATPQRAPAPVADKNEPPATPPAAAPRPAVDVTPTQRPLVSCIMPTRNRAEFVLQSIRYFQRQDYAERELIILDDGDDNLAERLPRDDRIRYVRLPGPLSIGAKRNRGCAEARGDIIAQWDDDDWYGPQRVSAQVAPILAGEATITGLMTWLFFDLSRGEFWRCSADLHRRMFAEDVHGGTLVYARQVWQGGARYPDRSMAEDALFPRQALRRGARLRRLPGDDQFIYLRHAGSSWAFACGSYVDPAGWQRAAEPPALVPDRRFYAERSALPRETPPAQGDLPLVSCIMPTANRRRFVPHAIAYFLRQDYPRKELVILDDGEASVADLMPDDPQVRYFRLSGKRTVGAKRNECVEAARGDLILHWDDDDWMAPHRLRVQVDHLLAANAEICGLRQMLHYDLTAGESWLYTYPATHRRWLIGGSLLYTRDFWRRSPFPNLQVGEDTRFVWSRRLDRVAEPDDFTFYVALIHPHNTSPKIRTGSYWSRWPGNITQLMGDDAASYVAPFGVDNRLTTTQLP